ncbi:unnamed protein product [Mytilus edulis]|uniref:Endonuclease/exonuclease/phosphatase domain-containing protein n=1 Tax=Mytilus edulis TaxID=6550 RepID=A0A8S3TC02_MYTED|nr:unnamed protein product [Mytilus edulis]
MINYDKQCLHKVNEKQQCVEYVAGDVAIDPVQTNACSRGKSKCLDMGANIIMPKTASEIAIAKHFQSSDGVVNQIWFGVTDFNKDGIWTWDDGTIASDNIFGCSDRDVSVYLGCSDRDVSVYLGCSDRDVSVYLGCSDRDVSVYLGLSDRDVSVYLGCSDRDVSVFLDCNDRDGTEDCARLRTDHRLCHIECSNFFTVVCQREADLASTNRQTTESTKPTTGEHTSLTKILTMKKNDCETAVTTTYAEVREAARQIMQGPVSACTYNTLVYRFTDKDGHTHDGYDDDRDYGIGSRILDYLKEIDAHNITIISSRTPPSGTAKIGSRKTILSWRDSTDYILKEKIADENGRYLILTVEIDNTDFVFVNYYAPTKNFENDQIEYIEKLKILLNEKLDQNLVLGGDFNTILNPSLDKMGGSKYNTPVKYTSKLEDFIEEFELCDIWRTKNVDSRLYTWRQRTPLIQCRLDFWLISNFLSSSVTKTSIVPSIKSDHSLIKLTLSGENFSERGPGFWKFNSGLLTDKDYVDIVKNTLSECDNKYHNLENKNLKWDTMKSEIRGATVKYSKYKNMKLRERESNLKKRQDEIQKNLSRTYLDKDINTLLIELDIVKDDLEQIVNNQTRGLLYDHTPSTAKAMKEIQNISYH